MHRFPQKSLSISKSIDKVPQLPYALNGSAATSHDIYATQHYGIDQLYLRKVP